MPTGACGIDCDVCKLRLLGICSSCGSGKSQEAIRKLEAQKRIFGNTCTILACACLNHLEYCPRDCSEFPCENFRMGPYPFSQGFLDMQERRRRDTPPAFDPSGRLVEVPPEYWERLRARDINTICNLALCDPHPQGGLIFPFLQEQLLVDVEDKCLKHLKQGLWEKKDDTLLELITLVYLNHVSSFHPLGKGIVSVKDLKEAHFFQGPHILMTAPLLERYGNDMDAFKRAAEYLNGEKMNMADAAYRLLPFPRIPLYYLLWEGDEEYKARLSILFDRSIEHYFTASGIWGLVNLVSTALLRGPDNRL